MSSYLQNQLNAFQSDVSSTASRLTQKRVVPTHPSSTAAAAAAAAAASSSLSSSSAAAIDKADLKRKRPEPTPTIVYSQPQDTGTGRHLMTQVTYAVNYLKSKDKPVSFKDIFDYLSIQEIDDQGRRTLQHILTRHEKIEYNRAEGTFRFRPVHNVRSADELLAYLQAQPTAQGIPVKELREGWPGAVDAIDGLELEHRLLVTRNKKDSTPKMVWLDDPSLNTKVDDEFVDIWRKLKVPRDANDLREELKKFGLTPSSQVKEVKVVSNNDKKKKKKAKSGGRTTNSHMLGVLKNYDHLRRA